MSATFPCPTTQIREPNLFQRIEAWWSVMRRQQCEWWISFFKDLVDIGGFHRGTINEM